MADKDFDMKGWEQVKGEVADLESKRGVLRARFDKLEEIYFMDWKSKDPNVSETISPDGRNKVDGASMLLTAAVPTFNVPKDKNNPDAEHLSSQMEKAANRMWAQSNSVQSTAVETDLAFSGFMYDEITARVISTKDMLNATKEAEKQAKQDATSYSKEYWKAEIEAAEQRSERTPYLFEALYPKIANPVWSRNEVLALYTKTEMRVADVRKDYGERGTKDLVTRKEWELVKVAEWFDKVYRYTWIDDASQPIYAEPHGLGFLPAASVKVKGKKFFDREERKNEPFLFSVLTSGIWPLQNAMLTAMANNVTALINSAFVFKPENAEAQLDTIRHEIIGNVIRAPGSLTPLSKELINRDTIEMWQMIDGIFEESTIYGQALGERVGGNAPFSMVALLAQAGRLPIVPVQRALRLILAQLMEIAFRWWKAEGKSYSYVADFKPGDIPTVIDFDVEVEPDLPQDKVQMANVVQGLTGGEDPILPKRWGREFLGEGQSDEIQKEIWTERTAQMAYALGQEMLLQRLMQKGQPNQPDTQPQQPPVGNAQGIPGGEQGMPVPPQTMPPELEQEEPGAMPGGPYATQP